MTIATLKFNKIFISIDLTSGNYLANYNDTIAKTKSIYSPRIINMISLQGQLIEPLDTKPIMKR
jgi:hypothetical protein